MDIKITKKQKVGVVVFLFIILMITSIIYFKNKSEVPKDELKKNRVLVQNNKEQLTDSSKEKEVKSNPSKTIKAYICGYVFKPGVYALKEGDRLDDLVKVSGGFTKEADPYGVNLAYQVKDQDYIRILSKDETKEKDITMEKSVTTFERADTNSLGGNSENTQSEKININTAPKEKLKELPRIGDALSQRIIDHREKEGSFKVIEDIREVSGIGAKMFENIKDKISVE